MSGGEVGCLVAQTRYQGLTNSMCMKKENLRVGAVGKSLTHEMSLGRASKKDLFLTNGDKKEQQ